MKIFIDSADIEEEEELKEAKLVKNIEVMNTFTLKNIPDLDVCVLAALELFSRTKIPKFKLSYKRPLVVGSGNSAATGRIIFDNKDAIFADESTYANKLKNIKAIDGIVLISASGGKHAPIIAKRAKKYKKHVTLITNNSKAPAKEFADKTYVLPKNREPYTYNTSTYMGMILGYTKEDPRRIKKFIENRISKVELPDLSKYNKFFFVLPEDFSGMTRLLNVKFIELFGRNIARDIETFEYMKHAVTVVPAKNELFISFGKAYKTFGEHHVTIPLPKNVNHGTMMAIGYYIVGQIQKSHPPMFKRNIKSYTDKISKVFGKKIEPIVE
jgi:hypothetical protein